MSKTFYLNKKQAYLLAGATLLLAVLMSINLALQSSMTQRLNLVEQTLWTVPKGAVLSGVCSELKRKDIVEDCFGLKLLAKFNPSLAAIKSGTYQLLPNMTLKQAITLFNEGKEHQFGFTLVEGENYFQVLDKLNRAPYLIDDISNLTLLQAAEKLGLAHSSPEGFLKPDTYFYVANTRASDLLLGAAERQKALLNKHWQTAEKTKLLSTQYDALILASIIEKESAQQSERADIASVFHNRLKKGMRLQTDPTVIYGVWQEYKGDITREHMRRKTPYNTYRINGLTPTPISNPSEASIIAALNPADTPYYYFVASGEGGHVFNVDLAGHNKALRQYLKKLKQDN